MRKIILHFLILCTSSLTIYAQIPTNSLVAYWPFNGNAADVSGNRNHGKVFGAALSQDRFGSCNSAYLFSGSEYIEIKDTNLLDFTTSCTISAWINPSEIPTPNAKVGFRIVDKISHGEWDGYVMDLLSPQTQPALRFMGGSNMWTTKMSNANIETDKWTHVATTYNQGLLKLYINGKLDKSVIETSNSISVNNLPLRIGSGNPAMNYFKGRIDDVRLYNQALSDDEIKSLAEEVQTCIKNVFIDTIYVYKSVAVTDTLRLHILITGINATESKANTLKVYPNPSKDIIYISTGDYVSMKGYSLKVTDLFGSEVFSSSINQPTITILRNFSLGTYLLKVLDITGRVVESKKLLVE